MTFRTVVTREFSGIEREIEIEAEISLYKGHRGKRDTLFGVRNAGPQLEPDEPPTAEVESACEIETGDPIDLTPAEEATILEKCNDYALQY